MPIAVNQTTPDGVDGADSSPETTLWRQRIARALRLDPVRLLWPSRCLVCTAAGLEGLDLCAACAGELPWNRRACRQCALPLADAGGVCGACLRRTAVLARTGRRAPLDEVHAACVYAPPLDRLLPRFKFHRDLAAGVLLSQLMAERFAGHARPGAVVPVPLHRSRLCRRGYDQALELAKPLARMLELRLCADLLHRARATAPQSELSATERRRNLRNAFVVSATVSLPMHVVLIDDVMTTGATLQAAATALRRAGVERVDAWVCARVP